jgi:hypothetical protein
MLAARFIGQILALGDDERDSGNEDLQSAALDGFKLLRCSGLVLASVLTSRGAILGVMKHSPRSSNGSARSVF